MNPYVLVALVLLVLSVLVDFTSKFMSITADLTLTGLAVYFMYLFYKGKPNDPAN